MLGRVRGQLQVAAQHPSPNGIPGKHHVLPQTIRFRATVDMNVPLSDLRVMPSHPDPAGKSHRSQEISTRRTALLQDDQKGNVGRREMPRIQKGRSASLGLPVRKTLSI